MKSQETLSIPDAGDVTIATSPTEIAGYSDAQHEALCARIRASLVNPTPAMKMVFTLGTAEGVASFLDHMR